MKFLISLLLFVPLFLSAAVSDDIAQLHSALLALQAIAPQKEEPMEDEDEKLVVYLLERLTKIADGNGMSLWIHNTEFKDLIEEYRNEPTEQRYKRLKRLYDQLKETEKRLGGAMGVGTALGLLEKVYVDKPWGYQPPASGLTKDEEKLIADITSALAKNNMLSQLQARVDWVQLRSNTAIISNKNIASLNQIKDKIVKPDLKQEVIALIAAIALKDKEEERLT